MNLDSNEYRFEPGWSATTSSLRPMVPHIADVGADSAWCGSAVGDVSAAGGAVVCPECCALGLEARATQIRRRTAS